MSSIVGWEIDNWPFSMIKFLDYYTIIFKDDGAKNIDMYEAYCSTDDVWDATKVIDTLAVMSPPDRYPLNIDFADFGLFYLVSYSEINSDALSVSCYYRFPKVASATNAVSALPIISCPKFVTCCNFKQQPVIGGIVSTDKAWTDLGYCAVAWGAIGQFEFRLSKNKTAGYVKMPWSDWDEGMVYKVARLGNGLMVYGNGGRAGLVPYSNQLVTGFGLKEMVGAGINKGFHFAGDENVHAFLGTDGELWVGTPDFKFQKLGYKEFFADLQAENDAELAGLPIVFSYDKREKTFYIGGFSSGYVLNQFGLYKCHQSSSSVGRYAGKTLAGFFKDSEDYEGRLSVDTLDFEVRGLKTVDHLEFASDYSPTNSHQAYGGVDFKYKVGDAYRSGNWIRLNNQGGVTPLKTAGDFRVKFKVDDYRDGDPKLNYINVRYKTVDKRGIRGPYAGSNVR